MKIQYENGIFFTSDILGRRRFLNEIIEMKSRQIGFTSLYTLSVLENLERITLTGTIINE